MNLLEGLNQSQKEAVLHIDGAMLILAGAGSGKTKTITTRLAYLIDQVGIPAHHTLTLTFTNKAANVMKNRALALIKNENLQTPLLCTFHKFGLLFLRLYSERISRANNFVIIDSDDKKKILKDLTNENLKNSLATIGAYISNFKNQSKSAQEIQKELEFLKDEKSKNYEEIIRTYEQYENFLIQNNFMDFDDLLMLTNKILEDEEFAKEQSKKYAYITVDEYQDTNALQYQILKKLCSSHENICVVGDDDQSIYGWRGAKIENILNFQEQFCNVKLIKLEQNYRSTNAILQAANELIEHNRKRLGKTLICTKDKGEEIEILQNDDEKIESFKIAKEVFKLLKSNINPSQIAILYRVNALSRALEEAFSKEKIPFKLLSGIRFYERAEIKDIISYLRLLSNFNDDYSFKRIINRPKRNFGNATLQKLQDYALNNNLSLFEALCALVGNGFFTKKTDNEVEKFILSMHKLKEKENLLEIITSLENEFKFKEFYKDNPEGEDKLLNIDEFYANLKDKISHGNYSKLDDILNEISLLNEQDGLDQESICIMSIHASKGLEFDYVFIVGLEEGFFPLTSESSNIEEERRLAYVAITRAKKKLYLSYANSRFYKGSRTKLDKSRFLGESNVIKKELTLDNNQKSYKKGDLIKHKIFGIGRITSVSKFKNEEKLTINFGGIERMIMSSFVEKII
ncbi:UvrD/REP family helicase [Campylobacter volucris]|uniref:DNA 3'-5' helicase n=1 Tax=Campylobacter volucris TaxID=1031542 RepID=A0AAE5YGA4_9BACT|nr:UvrD/REP family helicase [Campylobacter volucris]AJC94334.1 UvrD/REP family helicase [Campylobacter volucris LMG 24379]KAB0580484.1 UvrD/REP family helicase [Campylobacter volucris]QBL13304.1 UvrD/REP family helicase [Campylobacter volucris]QEL08550.1 UvrD/REP family helicase [Campylobacter volucris]TXK70340.1 UvrD/REP family helicase [Campylobacter volucris]